MRNIWVNYFEFRLTGRKETLLEVFFYSWPWTILVDGPMQKISVKLIYI